VPVRDPNFTPEQLEILRAFADHARSGRNFIVFMFRLSAFLGAIGTAILAYYAFVPRK
jgi:hypothetical protein